MKRGDGGDARAGFSDRAQECWDAWCGGGVVGGGGGGEAARRGLAAGFGGDGGPATVGGGWEAVAGHGGGVMPWGDVRRNADGLAHG